MQNEDDVNLIIIDPKQVELTEYKSKGKAIYIANNFEHYILEVLKPIIENRLNEDYLREKGYAESSIAIYSRRIKNFFKNGYSVDDLIGKLIDLIGMYSNGGSKFDPNDHGNTSNA